MSKQCKWGNPKKKSSFVCLRCKRKDGTIDGIQRLHGQREKMHVKDMYCCHCKMEIKALEIRYNDYLPELEEVIEELHEEFYGEDVIKCTK